MQNLVSGCSCEQMRTPAESLLTDCALAGLCLRRMVLESVFVKQQVQESASMELKPHLMARCLTVYFKHTH